MIPGSTSWRARGPIPPAAFGSAASPSRRSSPCARVHPGLPYRVTYFESLFGLAHVDSVNFSITLEAQ
jgi:hypothetical protein